MLEAMGWAVVLVLVMLGFIHLFGLGIYSPDGWEYDDDPEDDYDDENDNPPSIPWVKS